MRDATFVKAGEGLKIERRGTRAGHQYQLLGHSRNRPLAVEPYLVTLTAASDVFPVFQHEGIEFLYMLEGEVGYRHGDKVYVLRPGDPLYFDADVPHGPDELRKLPIRFLSIISHVRRGDRRRASKPFAVFTSRRNMLYVDDSRQLGAHGDFHCIVVRGLLLATAPVGAALSGTTRKMGRSRLWLSLAISLVLLAAALHASFARG